LSVAHPPNVVIILADDLGWGDLSKNNQDPAYFRRTPNLDRICDQGIFFTNYLTHQLCSPSRAGLLTGRRPHLVGSGVETSGTLDVTVPNLARDLQSHGYVTGAFGKWHNGYPSYPSNGMTRTVRHVSEIDPTNDVFDTLGLAPWGDGVNAYGFDRWSGFYSGAVDYFNRLSSTHHDVDWWIDGAYSPRIEGYTTDVLTDLAVEFITDHRDTPFFLFLPMQAPHAPEQIRRSDLAQLCAHLPGEWEYVSQLRSPISGRRIFEVEELRCERGGEFDYSKVDGGNRRFVNLVFATMLFSLDKSVGRILATLGSHGLAERTIVWLLSDNGSTLVGSNLPFRGNKGSLWEGGIHVPGAVWWPGHLDTETAPYTPQHNSYPWLLQYLDIYPTVMAMVGETPHAAQLDGINVLPALRDRVQARRELPQAFFDLSRTAAVIRTDTWKLLYNEVPVNQELRLYNLVSDPFEKSNVQSAHPAERSTLVTELLQWIADNRLTPSFLVPRQPAPSTLTPRGEILEIAAWQKGTTKNPDADGLFIHFVRDDEAVSPLDRVEFDLYMAADAEITQGLFFTPTRGTDPYFTQTNGVDQTGQLVARRTWPRECWTHVIVGIGNLAPLSNTVSYVALCSSTPGSYHFFLDNVVLSNADGTIRHIVWDDAADTMGILSYYFHKQISTSWEDISAQPGFPFSRVEVKTSSVAELSLGQLRATRTRQ